MYISSTTLKSSIDPTADGRVPFPRLRACRDTEAREEEEEEREKGKSEEKRGGEGIGGGEGEGKEGEEEEVETVVERCGSVPTLIKGGGYMSVGLAGEADDPQLGEVGEKVMSPCHSHLRGH